MAQDAQTVLGGRQFPVVVCPALPASVRVETKKKSRVGKGTSEQTDFSKNWHSPDDVSGVVPGPLAASPHNKVPLSLRLARLPADGRGKKVGNYRRWLPALDTTRLHRSSLGTWGFLVHGRES